MTPSAAPARGAIISPAIDFLFCGGLSIIAVGAFFVYSFIAPENVMFTRGLNNHDILLLGTWINAPHFMASYRLVYRTGAQINKHRWASIYAPFLLLGVIAFSLLVPTMGARGPMFANQAVVELFVMVATILLAWHYTGQAWGMTASFAYIAGIRMELSERRMIRSGCWSLLVWHILWACLMLPNEPPLSYSDLVLVSFVRGQAPLIEFLYNVCTGVVLLTIPVGIYGFWRLYQRTETRLPLGALSPWVAIYLWYGLIWAYPGVFAVLQIFHALQYLIFPIRVEINQYAARKDPTQIRRMIRGVAYYLVLVAIGYVVFFLPQLTYFWGDKRQMLAAMVFGFVNIHHYVIDGVIWKLRNPDVRRDLFAHLAPA